VATRRRIPYENGSMMRLLSLPLLLLLWIYRTFISPMIPAACRYHPSCSQYAQEAWAPGGPDPVPPPSRKRLA